MKGLAVFGLGPVGRALRDRAADQGWLPEVYTRSGQGAAPFDAGDREQVAALLRRPAPEAAVVTFPPRVADTTLWPGLLAWCPYVLLLGTTSSYRRDAGSPITSSTPQVEDHPRARVEQQLLEGGGGLLRLAGLYGGSRDPLGWLRRGRIGAEPRQVNLIHHEDAAAAALAMVQRRLAAAHPVSDGQRHTLRDLADLGAEAGLLDPLPTASPTRPDVEIDPGDLIDAVGELPLRDWRRGILGLPRSAD